MKTRAYALKLIDKKDLYKSSSGGAFTAFSNEFLDVGAIVSPIYNYETNRMEFSLYNSLDRRNEARGSKYIQALPLNIFEEAVDWMKNNQGKLLFVGVGCQAEGFRKFVEVKGFRNRVIIIDIICHGSPSPQIWEEYIKRIGKIDFVSFRDKRNGWHYPYSYVKTSKKEKSIKDYTDIFYSTYAFRPSCYECQFKGVERNCDITIGDFWGIEKAILDFDVEGGVSLVLIHTEKGQELLNKIRNIVECKECDIGDCLQPMLISSSNKPLNRDDFWRDYQCNGIEYIIKKYAPQPSLFRKVGSKIKKFIKKIRNQKIG